MDGVAVGTIFKVVDLVEFHNINEHLTCYSEGVYDPLRGAPNKVPSRDLITHIEVLDRFVESTTIEEPWAIYINPQEKPKQGKRTRTYQAFKYSFAIKYFDGSTSLAHGTLACELLPSLEVISAPTSKIFGQFSCKYNWDNAPLSRAAVKSLKEAAE